MRHTLIILSLALAISCQYTGASTDPYAPIKDAVTRVIITDIIEAAGGWEKYKAIKSVDYTKRSVLYHSDGSLESDHIENHLFDFLPTISGRIKYADDQENEILLEYSDNKVRRFQNQIIVKNESGDNPEKFNGALYTLLMPFKLLDPGSTIEYLGQVNIGERTVHDVIAKYDTNENPNQASNDEWHYYFDIADFSYVAALVKHGSTYALIENANRHMIDGMYWNQYRRSWRVDSLMKKQFLRAEYWYDEITLTMRE